MEMERTYCLLVVLSQDVCYNPHKAAALTEGAGMRPTGTLKPYPFDGPRMLLLDAPYPRSSVRLHQRC
jgi:hypothetical protein